MENIKLNGTVYQDISSVVLPTEADIAEFIAKSNLLQEGVMRCDAELVQTWNGDYKLSDKSVSIPSYSTSSVTLLAAAELTPTYTISYTDYNYYILERFLTIPEYSVTSKAKGREEYQFSSYLYEISEIPGSTYHALIDTSKYATSRSVSVIGQGLIRNLYWSSGTAVALYTATSYGIAQVAAAPALSSGVITAKAPSVTIRGSTTYLTSTYYNAMTDCRCQYVIELYRSPKNNLNLNGWGAAQNILRIASDVHSNSHKLT